MEELTGKSAAEVIGKHPLKVFPYLKAVGIVDHLQRVLAEGTRQLMEFHFYVPQTGRACWVSYTTSPLRNAQGEITGCISIIGDYTERKRVEERIARLSRTQAILSGIDHAIIHIPDRQKLLDEVCRVTVEKGGFKLAWVGMVAPDGLVQPVAQAGVTGYLDGIRVKTEDVPEGRGPAGTAIRENRATVTEDAYSDARMMPWRDRLRQFGLRYVASFPIRIGGKVAGTFQIYAPQPHFFDENELGLLSRVSDDISFALTAIAELTARNQAEEALHAATRLNQQIINEAREGIVVRDRDLRCLVWNPYMEELSGKTKAEVLGTRPLEVFPFLQADGVMERLERLLAGEPCADVELHLHPLEKGRPHWISDRSSALRNAKGEITGCLNIVRDITERKQAEESLRRSERNLASFFDQAPIGLVWLSAGGAILRANQAQLDLLGYPAQDYLGHALTEFCVEPSEGRELLERLAAQKTVQNFRMACRCKDGTIRHKLVDAVSFWSEGEFLYYSVFLRDITERVKLEGEILEAGERESRRIAQDLHDGPGQLLAGTAHLATTLHKDLAAKSRPEARQLKRISKLLYEAIAQERSLARGLQPVEPESSGLMVALDSLARQTKSLFQITCRFTCKRPVWIADNTVATHLYRIAQEAVSNAVKHGKPGRIEISLTRTPERIALSVRDNGAGLPARRGKNSGIGLRIMRYRAGMISGRLTIENQAGGGASVVCTAPLSGQSALKPLREVPRKKG
ncbi:MAG: PAS domain S-box protein [Verrucomicrobiota bacterium]|jgi:PAS domain S-box-containing protein